MVYAIPIGAFVSDKSIWGQKYNKTDVRSGKGQQIGVRNTTSNYEENTKSVVINNISFKRGLVDIIPKTRHCSQRNYTLFNTVLHP